MDNQISEGRASIIVPAAEKVSRAMPVFYNPVMEFNRDTAVLLLNSIGSCRRIALPLAGTGVRGIRMALELDRFASIEMNDRSPAAYRLMQKNTALNKVDAVLHNEDANTFLLGGSGWDYIDIDPFGSPYPFLDAAAKRISREGILAVTATDTAALCGTSPAACKRKYWATPVRSSIMHETGLRILLRKVQLVCAQYSKAALPIYSYFRDHYFRAYFLCTKSRKQADRLFSMHQMLQACGPLWTGQLWDSELAHRMHMLNSRPKNNSFLATISRESRIPALGFFEISKAAPGMRKESLIELLSRNHLAGPTHFSGSGIRTDATQDEIEKAIR